MIVSHKRVHNFVDVNGQPRSPWRAGRHSRGCLCWKSMVPDPRHADRRQEKLHYARRSGSACHISRAQSVLVGDTRQP